MSKKLVARTAKLLSENRRFKNDTGVSIAYEHQPKDPIERKHGILFAIIEIIGPTASSEEIAELIIDTLHGEYYKDLDKDPLESFEYALAKINEKLTEITEQGKIHWLGKLSGIIMVLSDKTVHLTQAGKAEAILYRSGKANVISEDLAGDAINPLRTFINIASGEVSEGDRIGIFSPGVFFHLSKEEIAKYVNDFHPSVAINHLANILEENNGSRRSSALIVEMITPEALSHDTIQDETEEDEVWITDSKKGIEAFTQSATPLALKIVKKSVGVMGLIMTFLAESLIPFVKKQFLKGKTLIKGVTAPKENIFVETKEALSNSRSEVMEFDEREDFTEKAPLEAARPIATENPKRSSLVYSSFKNFASTAKKTKSLIPKDKNLRVIAIGVLALFLITTSALSINKKRTNNHLSDAKKTLIEAQAKYDEADNFIILNENEKALADLKDSKTLTEKVKKANLLVTESDELLAKINGKLDAAMGIIKVSDTLSDLSKVEAKNTTGIVTVGTSLYTIDSENGTVYAVDIENGEASVVLDSPDIEGKVTAITRIDETNSIAILTDKPQVYTFDTKTKDFSKANISGEGWEKGVDIASFSTNLYVVSKDDKDIYKHIKTTGGYGKKVSYLKDASAAQLSDVVSIAIDGSVYVLKANGNVLKFTSGSPKDFSITGLPEALNDPKKIFTALGVKGIFIVNGDKVIRVDEKSVFVNQFTGDGFSNITGITANSSNLYILSGTKVYKVGL
ncbi:hypothetical protein COY62_03285 [bacterium (Candidatus Howlettbacteria) CG_4_10_14_0_8_um_filter_40_9]|nr:MAG: hypothetical protein COY62_03285 [bacterium (Candidatus Howlettbacteria) CG_4_10_14_0_8_um_filter_40_9]